MALPPPTVRQPFYYDCSEVLQQSEHNENVITSKIGPNGDIIEHETGEWSIHRWHREYCRTLHKAEVPKGDALVDRNVLFVDAREECERYREFLITVRQSGFLGQIVFLVYYPEDRDRCGRLEQDFAPLEIFYHASPRWEWTLFMYHGIAAYFRANPTAVDRYVKAAAVRPERVSWCTNVFDDVEAAADPRNLTVQAIWGSDPRYISVKPRHRSKAYKVVFQDYLVVGTPFALLAMVNMVLPLAHKMLRPDAEPSWSYFNSNIALSNYSDLYFRPLTPLASYTDGNCYTANACPYGAKGVRHHHDFCFAERRRASDTLNKTYVNTESFIFDEGEPTYGPFCYMEYRYPISELPHDLTLKHVADQDVVDGAKKILDAPANKDTVNMVFTNPSAAEVDLGWGVSDECPHGKLVVMTMMGGYPLSKVEGYISSFLYHAHPRCVKLVMMMQDRMAGLIDPPPPPPPLSQKVPTGSTTTTTTTTTTTAAPRHNTTLHQIAEMYPDRIEAAYFGDGEEYEISVLRGRSITDIRFEVMQLWLEKHYREYRYVLATDSKDYVFATDPLEQLVQLLASNGYLHTEFVGSVVESMALGSHAGVHNDAISMFAAGWMSPCGPFCYPHMVKQQCTNGEPLGVINSGHVIGTAVGVLHYTRCHLRLTVETKYNFKSVDQGLLTFYLQGLIQDAGFPHKVLLFASSRAGFVNPTHLNKVARRRIRRVSTVEGQVAMNPNDWEWEYTMMDCTMSIVAGIHQSNRALPIDIHLRNNSFLNGIIEQRALLQSQKIN